MEEPSNGKAGEFAGEEGGDFGLVDAKAFGGLVLCEVLPLDDHADFVSEVGFCEKFVSVWQAKVSENIVAAANHFKFMVFSGGASVLHDFSWRYGGAFG